MPWSVVKRGDQYCVVKDGSNKTVDCHAKESDAKRQQAALYANENSELAKSVLVEGGLSEESADELVRSLVDEFNSQEPESKSLLSEELTNQLLGQLPESVSDEDATKLIHDLEQMLGRSDSGGNNVSDEKTYSELELRDAISSATAPLEEKINRLEEADSEAEVERKIEEAKAEVQSKVEELEKELDSKDQELTAANEQIKKLTEDAEEFRQTLETAAAEAKAAAEAEERKEERVKRVTEVASFSDERIQKSADRWAAMSDEDFEALLEEYKDNEERARANNGGAPAKTVLSGQGGEEQAAKDGPTSLDIVKAVRRSGYSDPTKV